MILGLVGAVAVAFVAASLWWRNASRRRALPCPHWLGWVLDNPYTAWVAGSDATLDRLGVVPGMRVLDVGAGRGRVTIPAARRVGPGGLVVAVDVQERMLEHVRATSARFGLANVRTVPLDITTPDSELGRLGTFDRALLITVLGELPDAPRGLRAIHALLREDGLLAVTEMLPDPHYVGRQRLRALAAANGFDELGAYGSGLAYTLVLGKRRTALLAVDHRDGER